MGIERKLDECLKGTHWGGPQGGRDEVIVYTHKAKGQKTGPRRLSRTNINTREYNQKGDRAGP